MEKKLITVFTPTYNRIKFLPHCYESLRRQTSKNFCWLVIDDGSEDGTDALVKRWICETTDFEIRYIGKENGGLHTAYNAAIEAIDTELAVCVDSDDYLTDDAIALIETKWKASGSDGVAGIVALNQMPKQEILGQRLPDLEMAHIIELYCKYGCRSDLKMIHRTQLLKEEGPIPVFGREKHMNPYYLFLKIDKKLPMLLMNQPVCVVNYQSDGMSADIIRQYVQSPRSFAALRLMMVSMERAAFGYRLKHSIHLTSSALMAGDVGLLRKHPHKWIASMAFLPGVLLFSVIKLLYWKRYR